MKAQQTSQWPVPVSIAPDTLTEIQSELARDWAQVCEKVQQGQLECPKDRRFSGEAWAASQPALLAAHSYLLSARTMFRMVDAASVPDAVRSRLRFSVMQWVEAMSPTNFLASNPEALGLFLQTQGESLQAGMRNLLSDLQKGRLSQTDESGFRLGENLAASQGAVVFENRLMQVIQYAPSTPSVHARPLLMVPPCINKFYILDLQPGNSLVEYAVSQGLTVFMISWRNPLPNEDGGIDACTWEDYLEEGVLTAVKVAGAISGQKQINALGFCVGGTMLASALALAKARGESPVAALTLLTTMLDFCDTGVLDVFVDEVHAQWRERQLGAGGLMSARELNTTFSFLRPSELVWNYVADNYLKGRQPAPFDILYWNADSTNLPGPFFTWYFRNTYLENRLKDPGGVSVGGVPIDLGAIDVPCYLYGSREDHIVPWRSAYLSGRALGAPVRFVLGASGHIAGVVNPPSRNKRSYQVAGGESVDMSQEPDNWLERTDTIAGSWWPDLARWLKTHSGPMRKARTRLGSTRYPVIEDAPGRYVRVRAT